MSKRMIEKTTKQVVDDCVKRGEKAWAAGDKKKSAAYAYLALWLHAGAVRAEASGTPAGENEPGSSANRSPK